MIEAGELRLSIRPLDLTEIAEDLVSALKATEIAHDVMLKLDICSSTEGVWMGDCKRIRRVLSNLVINAVKFTSEGGGVVRMKACAKKVRFEVEDDGPGVPEDHLDAIFERFHQVEEQETRRHGGVGIGLNISRQLVSAMRGQIGVISEEGRGATFWFEIPLTREKVVRTA